MAKPKECKGNYRVSHFKGCKSPFIYKYGLCSKCFQNWCKSTDEGAEWVIKNALPKAKASIKAEKKRSTVNFKGKLQERVQEIARLLDMGQDCMARGKMALSYDGGHVWGKGAHCECSLNLHNIFAQDSKSNQSTTEDALMAKGVENYFGLDYYNFVESLKNKPVVKLSKLEYEQIYRRACKIANELKKEGKVLTKEERITERNRINLILDIYSDEQSTFNL
jgi:hypothetical protein